MEHHRTCTGESAVEWQEHGAVRSAPWRRAGRPPLSLLACVVADDLSAAEALRFAARGTGLLWRGDYRNGRQLLDAMKRRLDRSPVRGDDGPSAVHHRYRQSRSRRARLLGMVLIELDAADKIALARAPDVRDACVEAFGPPLGRSVITLPELLGAVAAQQWRRRGVPIPALGARIHPHYGVFAPTRTDYVHLVATAPLPTTERAVDIGTGTGVLAAVLARRGVERVVATDVSPAAVACARDNAARLGLGHRIEVRHIDLFPRGRAGLVVCNPPWLPGTPTSPLDAGVFDPGGRMLARLIRRLPDHLTADGEAWIVLSDLAELLGLRTRAEFLDGIACAGLVVHGRLDTPSSTGRGDRRGDPLADIRFRQTVSLWRLRPRPRSRSR